MWPCHLVVEKVPDRALKPLTGKKVLELALGAPPEQAMGLPGHVAALCGMAVLLRALTLLALARGGGPTGQAEVR